MNSSKGQRKTALENVLNTMSLSGLKVSKDNIKKWQRYIDGKMTTDELGELILEEILKR